MVRRKDKAPAEATPSELEWRERLDVFDRSGLTQTAFAAVHGIRRDALSWWRCELKRRDRVRKGLVAAPEEPGAPLLPVSILTTPARVVARVQPGATVDVVVRGVAVRVGRGFDAELVRAVVDALAEPC